MTGTAVRGTWGVGFEAPSVPGLQPLLSPQVLAAAVSATNQPTLTAANLVGVHIYIIVQSVAPGASATITITGKAADGVTAVTETTTAISAATADSNGNYYYCTNATFGSINASGISASSFATSLVSATVTIYGIMGAKYLVPAVAKFEESFDYYSPEDMRGIQDKHIRDEQLIKKFAFDITSSLYPESDQFFAPACVGNVTNPATPASVPASAVTLKGGAAISTLAPSYVPSTAPTSPGMLVAFIFSTIANTLAGTITITGTAWNTGAPQSEVINVLASFAAGTLYSVYSYASITSIALTGLTQTTTLSTKGVFAYNPVYNPTNALTPLSSEWYSGTDSMVYSYLVPEEFTLEYDVSKELKFSMKGACQEGVPIGDTTLANLTASNFATYAQPIDYPMASWPSAFYLDPIGGTAGTTLWGDIITLKINGKTGLKPYWTGNATQWFNRVGRTWRETTFEAEIDFINLINYQKFRAFSKMIFVARFLSPYYLGVNGTTPIYKSIQVVMNAHFEKWEKDPKDEKVTVKVMGVCEYDPTSGYAFNVSFMNQNNPNYSL